MFRSAYTVNLDWNVWLSLSLTLLRGLVTNTARPFPLEPGHPVKHM